MPSRTTTTAASELLPQNTLRKSFIIQNEDGTDSVYIKFERPGTTTVSSTVHDHRLGPGGILGVNSLTDGKEQIQERVTIIASANTPRVSYFETEDVKR